MVNTRPRDLTPIANLGVLDVIPTEDISEPTTTAVGKTTVGAVLDIINGDINVDSSGTATFGSGVIVNADINAAAAIAYSKLALTGAILNADLAGSIALSKLATDPLARANHTGTQLKSTISDFAHTHVEADITDLQAYLTGITGESIGSLSDVTNTLTTNRFVLVHNGAGVLVSRALTEADISDLGSYSTVGHGHTESDISDLGTTVAMVADKLSVFAATTSAELKTVISDETGSGALVFATSPVLVTPVLGTPTSGTLTNCTAPASIITSGTLVHERGGLEADVSAFAGIVKISGGATSAVPFTFVCPCSDEKTTAISADTGVFSFRMPFAFTVTGVRASLQTASTSGVVTIDINESGTTILSTKLTIDQDEKTSTTAATAAVISDSGLADDAEITIDIDGAGTGAKGLKVTLIGYPT